MIKRVCCGAALSCLIAALPAQASVLVTFTETAAGVVSAGSGTVNLAGLSLASPSSDRDSAFLNPYQTSLVLGSTSSFPNAPFETLYNIGGQNIHFGPTNSNSTPATGSGDSFGVFGVYGFLVVPTGYVSNTALSATNTFTGATFSSLGLTAGTYTLTIPNNQAGTANDTFVVQVGPVLVASPVPEPAAWGMLILGMGMVGGVLRRRVRASEVRFDAKVKRIAAGEAA